MKEMINGRVFRYVIWIAALSLVLIEAGGCKPPARIYKIGFIGGNKGTFETEKGFTDGLAELGYINGKNLRYINRCITDEKDLKDIKAGIREILDQDVDLLLTLSPDIVMMAKEIVKGTDTPVLFCGDASPVEDGYVESISHPGGNLTGVKAADTVSKSLEWLIKIIPNAKKIWVPYDPEDRIAAAQVPKVKEAAYELDIELVLYEVGSIKDAVAGMENLPDGIDAVLRIPTAVLDHQNEELSRIAIERRIPMGAAILLDESVLVTFVTNFQDAGKKAARLAQQILEGVKPADLPVETAEVFLTINMKTAEKIGVHVPDAVLMNANKIIR